MQQSNEPKYQSMPREIFLNWVSSASLVKTHPHVKLKPGREKYCRALPEYEDRDRNENRKEHSVTGGRVPRKKKNVSSFSRVEGTRQRTKRRKKSAREGRLRGKTASAASEKQTEDASFSGPGGIIPSIVHVFLYVRENALRFLPEALTTLRAPRSSERKSGEKVEKLRRTREPSAPAGPSSRSQLLLDRSSDQSPVILNYLADAPLPPDGETSPNVSSGKFPPHDRKLIRPRRVWYLMNVDPTRADT